MSKFNLTNGALETILTGGTIEKPTIQVLGVKKIQSQTNTGPDRYRLLLSDGIHSVSSVMLATQLNAKVEEGEIETNCVIIMDRFICNTIQTHKKVIVLLELRVLGSNPSKIGEPQALKQPLEKKTLNDNVSMQHDKSKSSNNTSSINNSTNVHNNSTTQKTTSDMTPSKIFPIASLTPYLGRWCIKARVTLKTKIRTWSNAKGEGQLFSFNLADQSSEIRVTAFKNDVDRFFNLIELNKVYIIKRGQLKAANKQFSNLPNDYEMTLSNDSEIIPVDNKEDEGLPEVVYNFVSIDQVQNIAPNTFIDLIGVVKGVEDVKVVIQKSTNKELKKRDVFLVDQSNTSIRLTLWGDNAEQFESEGHPVVVLRGCKVTDWNGRSLGESTSTQLIMNPPMKEVDVLRGWWDKVGQGVEFTEYKRDGAGSSSQGGTQWLTFEELSAQDLEDRAEYFQTKATITAVKKDNCLYMACPQAECNKKVVDQGNNMYRCEKCAQEFDNFRWRLILQMNVCDLTGNHWLTCFQDSAELILQTTAQNIGDLKQQDDSTPFDDIFNKANFSSFIFKNRARMEKYNDENRLKTVCLQVTAVDHVQHSERLLSEVTKILGDV